MRFGFKLLKDAFVEWNYDNAPRLSAALAFYTILSISPLFVIITAMVGFLLGEEAVNGQLATQLRDSLGDAGAKVVTEAVANADKPASGLVSTVLSVLTLLLGASGVFGELQSALNTVWNVKARSLGIFGTLKKRLISFGMVLVIGFLLLVSLIASAAAAAVQERMNALFPGGGILLQGANFILSFGLVTGLFAMIYKMLPDVEIAWRDVWLGAAVTAGLFTIGKFFIGLYLGQASVATPFGAAGSLVVFVVWVYYSGLIVLFGAEFTQVLMRRLGREIRPTEGADAVTLR